MTFGRWLLVHSFSIFLVSLFVLGYFYREELQLEKAYNQLLNLDASQLTRQVSVDTPKPESSAQDSTSKDAQLSAKAPDQQWMDNTQPTIEQSESVNSVMNDAADESAPMPSTTEATFAPNTDFSGLDPVLLEQDQLLQQARQAYWDKEYEQSINFYQQLIVKNQDNPDFPGELGNIYYALNDYPNASQQFYQAAQILIRQQQFERAKRLIAPVTAMNRELGDRLSKTLQ